MLSVDDVREGLERRGLTVRKVGRGYLGQCPCHDDRDPSLGFGDGADGGAYICCHAGCKTADVVRALGVNGSAVPLSAAELEARLLAEEADRLARSAGARARHQLALAHPDRRPALEWFSPALRWDAEDLLRRGVGWDSSRIVFPILGEDGVLVGVDRYAPPGSRARARAAKEREVELDEVENTAEARIEARLDRIEQRFDGLERMLRKQSTTQSQSPPGDVG